MQTPNEYNMVEKPIIDHLEKFGYFWLTGEAVSEIREDEFSVIIKSIFIKSVKKLNNIDNDEANRLYTEFIRETDNEECIKKIRGKKSFKFVGEKQSEFVDYIDFEKPENNIYTIVNQLYIKGLKGCIPDLIVYVNGIPLVVIECKGPIANQDVYSGIKQINHYERDIPKLFYSNIFNISTDGYKTLYGATGAGSKYFLEFKDPYPRKKADFASQLEMACYSLLEPKRLLDFVYNFVLFEIRDNKKTKKICRYQQYRAVNKIVDRVVDGDKKKGLIWHTQGSGKSLTMFYAAYKLKLTEKLENPNVLLITDRVDLDDQISQTFVACGFRNPVQIESIKDLQDKLSGANNGQTFLSTIHKFDEFAVDDKVQNSEKFIIFVDECHRTQEGNMGTKLRAVFPDSFYFGFTGTPIKKQDRNTYENFGISGEKYLDKYGIEDAINDNVTVPIFYENHTAQWNMDSEKLDVLYEETFRELNDDQKEELKKRESRIKNIIKNKSRIELISMHIATHYKKHVMPNGFKAQLVAIDREAIVLYKSELNKYFADEEVQCVYSKSQHDDGDFVKYYADKTKEKNIKEDFKAKDGKIKIIIVCDKLLTGFDAPIEQAMYLDSPLKEHNLLQAIARTNRVYANKVNGLIIDYFGISSQLSKALSSYVKEDVENAMKNINELKEKLKSAHKQVMLIFKNLEQNENVYKDVTNAVNIIKTKDMWYDFGKKFKIFTGFYDSLAPDPQVLKYLNDLKWLSAVHAQCKLKYEPLDKSIDYDDYGAKVKEMIDEHLRVTGLRKLFDIKDILDPDFFDKDKSLTPEQNALKKSATLKRVLEIKVKQNPIIYKRFSEYLKNAIDKYGEDVEKSAEFIKELERIAKLINEEDASMEDDGLNRNVKSYFKLLEEKVEYEVLSKEEMIEKSKEIDEIFAASPDACFEWQKKDEAMKALRRLVKRASIGIIKDKDAFANEIIAYAKENYHKG